jgi:hypothetical protein
MLVSIYGSATCSGVELDVRGQGSLADLAMQLNELDGIVDVRAEDVNEFSF